MRSVRAGGWAESTHAEVAWGRSRASPARWGWAGVFIGAWIAAVCFVPASWLAGAVSAVTQQRFMLADARGTVWSGSAVVVLTGGPGSRDASALPGRLAWTLHPQGLALKVELSQPCCLNGRLGVLVTPHLGGFSAMLQPTAAALGQWPSGWLMGLGTPWNTVRLGGTVRLLSSGLTLDREHGRWRLAGGLDVELVDATSRLSTLETLGSYRLALQGAPRTATGTAAATAPGSAEVAHIALSTMDGALRLSGHGSWGPGGLNFQGEAVAREADDAALTNLLNIIGRRDGARSVISIG